VSGEWVALVVSEELAESEGLAALEESVALEELAASVGATGHRSGSITRSIAAVRLMEIEARPTGSVA
jgi:hypothetical protein